jgi:hypothetical protein
MQQCCLQSQYWGSEVMSVFDRRTFETPVSPVYTLQRFCKTEVRTRLHPRWRCQFCGTENTFTFDTVNALHMHDLQSYLCLQTFQKSMLLVFRVEVAV